MDDTALKFLGASGFWNPYLQSSSSKIKRFIYDIGGCAGTLSVLLLCFLQFIYLINSDQDMEEFSEVFCFQTQVLLCGIKMWVIILRRKDIRSLRKFYFDFRSFEPQDREELELQKLYRRIMKYVFHYSQKFYEINASVFLA